jgi:hypothetical protein
VPCAASEPVGVEHPATSAAASVTAGAKFRQVMAHSVADRGGICGTTSNNGDRAGRDNLAI